MWSCKCGNMAKPKGGKGFGGNMACMAWDIVVHRVFDVLKKRLYAYWKDQEIKFNSTQQTLFMDFYAVHNTIDTCDQGD